MHNEFTWDDRGRKSANCEKRRADGITTDMKLKITQKRGGAFGGKWISRLTYSRRHRFELARSLISYYRRSTLGAAPTDYTGFPGIRDGLSAATRSTHVVPRLPLTASFDHASLTANTSYTSKSDILCTTESTGTYSRPPPSFRNTTSLRPLPIMFPRQRAYVRRTLVVKTFFCGIRSINIFYYT